MAFEDELRAEIQKGKQERAQEEQDTRDFESGWSQLRQDLILRMFREAREPLNEAGIANQANFDNGSVTLHAVWNGRYNHFEHSLTFSPDREARKVTCTYSLTDEEGETFDLDRLTEGVIGEKIKRLAYLIARGRAYSVNGVRVF